MISVLYSKLESFDKHTLQDLALRTFPHKDNVQYIEKLASKKNGTRACESLTALVLLGMLVQSRKADLPPLIIKKNDNGKPFFLNSSLHFSLTHSKGICAAAISDAGEIGIDLECTEIPQDKQLKLAKRFFNNDEIIELGSSPDLFALIWTRKEAYAKLSGISLSDLITKEKRLKSPMRKKVCFISKEIYGYPITICSEEFEADIIVSEARIFE